MSFAQRNAGNKNYTFRNEHITVISYSNIQPIYNVSIYLIAVIGIHIFGAGGIRKLEQMAQSE